MIVEQSTGTIAEPLSMQLPGAAGRVYLGIMQDLEQNRLVAGQRLVETELATRFEVGRNAVREAMQHLAARGVVDLSRHRSASIRHLDREETLEVLNVAEALTVLLVRTAAQRFDPAEHEQALAHAIERLETASQADDPSAFSAARRGFYRALLMIGGNRELQRIFPAIGMHIIYSQYRSRRLQELRLADYRRLQSAIAAGDKDAAERAGRDHVERIRSVVSD